jgi:hypothetical protein
MLPKYKHRFENEAEFGFVPAATRVVLNVGGQVFESTAEVLCRDRFRYLTSNVRLPRQCLKSTKVALSSTSL